MELDELYVRCLLITLSHDSRTSLTYRKMAKKMALSYAGARKRLLRLADCGLIEHRSPGEISLTREGAALAGALRNDFSHIYIFLRYILELSHEEADRDAYIFTGGLSAESREKMNRYVVARFSGEDADGLNIRMVFHDFVLYTTQNYNHDRL